MTLFILLICLKYKKIQSMNIGEDKRGKSRGKEMRSFVDMVGRECVIIVRLLR